MYFCDWAKDPVVLGLPKATGGSSEDVSESSCDLNVDLGSSFCASSSRWEARAVERPKDKQATWRHKGLKGLSCLVKSAYPWGRRETKGLNPGAVGHKPYRQHQSKVCVVGVLPFAVQLELFPQIAPFAQVESRAKAKAAKAAKARLRLRLASQAGGREAAGLAASGLEASQAANGPAAPGAVSGAARAASLRTEAGCCE